MNSYIRSGSDYPSSELTSKIIKSAITVHKGLGPGYQEVIYQRALSKQLRCDGIEHQREQWIQIYYQHQKVGNKRVDFIFKEVLLEIKAKKEFEDRDFIQTLSYLKASNYKIGLLINFGSASLQIKRFIK